MVQISLSTMWAQGRFDRLSDFTATARRLGFNSVEVNYTVSPEKLAEMIEPGKTPAVSSLHAPMPRVQVKDGRWSEDLNLASVDEEEREIAVQMSMNTIDWAARLGAGYVVLHLGGVGNEMTADELNLRLLYDTGHRDGVDIEALRKECIQKRAAGAHLYFPQAQKSLRVLAEHAEEQGVALGLENRYHYHEMPSVDEMHGLLAEFPTSLVGYWHDVGHAEVLGRLGLVDKYRWLTELKDRCLGSHVHDVDGIGDHRPPGRGDADWDYVAQGLPPDAPRVLEINQRMPEEYVASALPFLRERGVL